MFVRVTDSEEGICDVIEIPVDDDGCITLATVRVHFPGASGLKYFNEESGAWRAVRVCDEKLSPSEGSWNDIKCYQVVYLKDAKRKVDDDDVCDPDSSKLRRVDQSRSREGSPSGGHQNNNNRSTSPMSSQPQCTDLIVLGVNFKSTEDALRSYFEQFGELTLCEIKRDFNGNSKGFGFIRFKEYDSQIKVLRESNHSIDGRSCQIKVPESKTGIGGRNQAMRKIFVARLPQGSTSDELRKYFSKFGEVVDVYMSQPFRSFGFVTFRDSAAVSLIYTQQHILNGATLHIGPAEPKGVQEAPRGGYQHGPAHGSMMKHHGGHGGGHHGGHGGGGFQPPPSMMMSPGPASAFNDWAMGGGSHHSGAGPSHFSSHSREAGRHSHRRENRRGGDHPDMNSGYEIAMAGGNNNHGSQAVGFPGDFGGQHASGHDGNQPDVTTQMAQMLTPAMMATFLNLAAQQQQQSQQNMMAAAAAFAAAASGVQPTPGGSSVFTNEMKDMLFSQAAGNGGSSNQPQLSSGWDFKGWQQRLSSMNQTPQQQQQQQQPTQQHNQPPQIYNSVHQSSLPPGKSSSQQMSSSHQSKW